MIILATLFDQNYLAKGQSLIASLRRHAPKFMLYVLALDESVYSHLQGVNGGIIPIRLSEIESSDLLAAKANRTKTEYIWTLASCFTWYCAERYHPASIAYIDADCYLFSDPSPLYDEVSGFPVAITPHRYTPSEAPRLKGAGIFNVGWVYFEREGFDCLHDWRDKCVSWCYHRIERDGRFADQGYLDAWPAEYGAHVVYNLGVNLAPWNQYQYDYFLDGKDNGLIVSDGRRYDNLIMYHFHGFDGVGFRTGYPLHPMVAEHVYKQYEAEYARWMG